MTLSEIGQTQKDRSVGSHFCEVSSVGRSGRQEAGRQRLGAGDCVWWVQGVRLGYYQRSGGGQWRWPYNTASCIMPLNCTLKMVNLGYIVPQGKKLGLHRPHSSSTSSISSALCLFFLNPCCRKRASSCRSLSCPPAGELKSPEPCRWTEPGLRAQTPRRWGAGLGDSVSRKVRWWLGLSQASWVLSRQATLPEHPGAALLRSTGRRAREPPSRSSSPLENQSKTPTSSET